MRFRKHPSGERVGDRVNAGAALLDDATGRGGTYALTYIDSVGVIERASFVDVGYRALQWRHLLGGRGFEPGDRVVVLAGRDREWRSALLGALQAGGVVVPCAASTPVEELSAVGEHVGGKRIFYASARPRPDLEDEVRGQVLATRELDPRGAVQGAPPPHVSDSRDAALVFCTRRADGLHSETHSHASLLAQAETGESWLGAGPRQRVWSTVGEGSPASVWVALAAWRAGAELVTLEETLAPREQIELLARLRPAAVWFADGEYAELASEGEAAEFAAGSIGRVLSDGSGNGAPAFAGVVRAPVVPVPELDEAGAHVIAAPDVEPAGLPEGAEPTSPDAPTEREEADAEPDRWLAAEQALHEQQEHEAEEQRLADEALAREQAEQRRVEEERRQESERARREEEERRQQALAQREDGQRAQAQQPAPSAEAEPEPEAAPASAPEEPLHEQPQAAPTGTSPSELAPGILSQITAYGGAARSGGADERRDTA
jgi:acyl-CoA synthetase (AMP-forming)/AMP-acid ligase II